MEATGVTLDTVALKQSSGELTASMNKLEQEVYELAGTEFNINSTKQVGEILFDRLKAGLRKRRRPKQAVTVPARMYWRNFATSIPSSASFFEYRGLKKLLSTYIDALPELINPQTGKIHTSFNQAVTSTGRLSSTNPNLQTFRYGTIWAVRSVRHLSRTIRIASSSRPTTPRSSFVSWPT